MDTYEVTTRDFRRFLEKHPQGTERLPTCNLVKTDREDHPVNCVTWEEALHYCQWLNKDLPTEAEWEKAARGNNGRALPWGSGKPQPGWSALQTKNWTDPIGTHERDRSFFGVADMLGNVREWLRDFYQPDYWETAVDRNPQGPSKGDYHVVRGESFSTARDLATLLKRQRNLGDTGRYQLDYGFRCVRRPPQ
jgi:iron(II)-dependent oxidoreductase